MSDERWRPLHVRTAGKQAEYDAPVHGIPSYLRQPLIDWLTRNYLCGDPAFGSLPSPRVLHRVEVVLRLGLNWGMDAPGAYFSLLVVLKRDPQFFLDVVDLALRDLGDNGAVSDAIDRLDEMLRDGASAWMVAPDRRGLAERVLPELAESARQVIQSGSRAGELIAQAWRRIYGRDRDPSGGYHEAVRAVEAAARPIVVPNDATATLGKIIGTLRSEAEKFATVFGSDLEDFKPLDAVRDLMSLVWKYQRDRHGTDDESVPLHVSPEQAEAALHAALTLVQWFQRGFVRAAGA